MSEVAPQPGHLFDADGIDGFLLKCYEDSPLPYGPDEPKIKALLLQCIEMHYGSLDKCVVNPDAATQALREIAAVIERNRVAIGI